MSVDKFTDATIRRRLGCNIAIHRQRRGWTQAHLAEVAQISPSFLMYIEQGTRGASLETVEVLAEALEVDVSELFILPSGLDFSQSERIALHVRFKHDILTSIEEAVDEVINRYAKGL